MTPLFEVGSSTVSVHRIATGGAALLPEVRRLADEVGVLDRRPGHARLDEVEVELELVAVGAIALLEPRRHRVRPDPDRDQAVRLPASQSASQTRRPCSIGT